MKAEIRKERKCCAAGFEYGGRDHEPRNAGLEGEVGKAREQILPSNLQKEPALLTP